MQLEGMEGLVRGRRTRTTIPVCFVKLFPAV